MTVEVGGFRIDAVPFLLEDPELHNEVQQIEQKLFGKSVFTPVSRNSKCGQVGWHWNLKYCSETFEENTQKAIRS